MTADFTGPARKIPALAGSRTKERLLALVRSANADSHPSYLAALETAVEEEAPPFGTLLYAELHALAATCPQWMVFSLVLGVKRDAAAAERAWAVSGGASGEDWILFTQRGLRLAADARSCIMLADLAFPGVLHPELRADLLTMVPDLPAQSPGTGPPLNLETLVRSNLEALRCATLLLLRREPLLVGAPTANLEALRGLLDEGLTHTLDHVATTASRIDPLAHALGAHGAASLFTRCMHAFARDMAEEPVEFTYNQRFGIHH